MFLVVSSTTSDVATPYQEIAVLLALRCFHSICENCEALLIAKTDLSAAIYHGLAHLAASRASRCITRVAQLIICFRVERQRTRRHSC